MENKYQTAFNEIKEHLLRRDHWWSTTDRDKYLKTLQELVNREKPMKVTEKWSDDCPKCGEFMIDTCEYALRNIPFIKYCPHCGQKLDWSEF